MERNELATFVIPSDNALWPHLGRTKRHDGTKKCRPHRDPSHCVAYTLAAARDVALLFGHKVEHGWPVHWGEETCHAVIPGLWGHNIDDPLPHVEVREVPRRMGAYLFRDVEHCYPPGKST